MTITIDISGWSDTRINALFCLCRQVEPAPALPGVEPDPWDEPKGVLVPKYQRTLDRTHWHKGDDAELIDLHCQGFEPHEIAHRLCRSEKAIEKRLSLMRLAGKLGE